MYIRHIFSSRRGKSSIHHHSPHCKPQKRTQKTFCIIFLSLSVVAVIMELFCCYFPVCRIFLSCALWWFFYCCLGARRFINPYIWKRFFELILALISNLSTQQISNQCNVSAHRDFHLKNLILIPKFNSFKDFNIFGNLS